MTWVGSWVTQTHSTVTSCETNQRLGLALAEVMSTITLQALRLQLKTQLVDTKDDKDNNFTKNPINKPSGRLQRQIKIWNWRRKWPNLNSCVIKLKYNAIKWSNTANFGASIFVSLSIGSASHNGPDTALQPRMVESMLHLGGDHRGWFPKYATLKVLPLLWLLLFYL